MAFSNSYKRLFEVECWHGYHLNTPGQEFGALDGAGRESILQQKAYDVRADMAFVPTDETAKRMAGEGLICKTLSTGFFVAIRADKQADGAYLPWSLPTEGLKLTFYLTIRNPQFFNYTNLPLHENQGKIYYFGNRTAESASVPDDATLYLSGKIPEYQEQPYRAGDLVQTGSQIYESLMDQATPSLPSGNAAWNVRGAAGYVHGGDRVARFGPISNFTFQSGKVLSADFVLKDLDQVARTVRLIHEPGNVYALTETDARGTVFPVTTVTAESGNALQSVQLDLRNVPAGRYALHVSGKQENGDEFEEVRPIYLMHESRQAWAVLEVVYLPGEQLGPYKMIDSEAGNALLSPRYVLHFPNRSTYWRYRFGKVPAKKPRKSELLEEDGAYVTPRPQPLTRSYNQITYNNAPLPNPSVGTIKPEQSKIYSDIYL